jgi:hypothetical protein
MTNLLPWHAVAGPYVGTVYQQRRRTGSVIDATAGAAATIAPISTRPDLRQHAGEDLDTVAQQLNSRPRKTSPGEPLPKPSTNYSQGHSSQHVLRPRVETAAHLSPSASQSACRAWYRVQFGPPPPAGQRLRRRPPAGKLQTRSRRPNQPCTSGPHPETSK